MRSLPDTTTTRDCGLASTSRSPSVGTRRLPGPATVAFGGKLSRGRPCFWLKRVIASSLSNTTVSPFGPSPRRTTARPGLPGPLPQLELASEREDVEAPVLLDLPVEERRLAGHDVGGPLLGRPDRAHRAVGVLLDPAVGDDACHPRRGSRRERGVARARLGVEVAVARPGLDLPLLEQPLEPRHVPGAVVLEARPGQPVQGQDDGEGGLRGRLGGERRGSQGGEKRSGPRADRACSSTLSTFSAETRRISDGRDNGVTTAGGQAARAPGRRRRPRSFCSRPGR